MQVVVDQRPSVEEDEPGGGGGIGISSCPRCGADNPTDAYFCESCGSRLRRSVEEEGVGLPRTPRRRPGVDPERSMARRELVRIQDRDAFEVYAGGIAEGGEWSVLPLYFMGTKLDAWAELCPVAVELAETLPRSARRYAWGDALFSRHRPGTRLAPHASFDDLRVRFHLGLEIPSAGAGLQIGIFTKNSTRRSILWHLKTN